jgi:transketolase
LVKGLAMDIRDAFFGRLYEKALVDEDIIVLSADTDSFGLRKLKADRPNQYINVGVAEQNAILVATGLAMCGKKPYVYSIIPFITFRVFEQIKANICSMNLPITIVGVGAGLSFSFDGPTHHAVSDIAAMRVIPELSIYNPSNPQAAAIAFDESYKIGSPSYIRLDKGEYPSLHVDVPFGYVFQSYDFFDLLIISTGTMVHTAISVVPNLKDTRGVHVIDLFRLTSIDIPLLTSILHRYRGIVVLEENTKTGGIFSIVTEALAYSRYPVPLLHLSLPDEQCFKIGSREYLLKQYGLDARGVSNSIEKWQTFEG